MINNTRLLLSKLNVKHPVRVAILLAAAAGYSAPVLAQPGTTSPENPRQPDAPSAPAAAPKPGDASATQKEEFVHVTLSTSMGDIVIALNKTKAPISTENFVKYMEAGHYDGTIFHRVIDGFMIQGGGFDQNMKEKKTEFPPIKNEWQNGLKNERGTIAMARTSDADSAKAQFFINVNDNRALDQARPQTGNAGYAVFGKVISGMEVVDKIKGVKTGNMGPHGNVPSEPVVINKVRVSTTEEVSKAGK